MNESKCYSLAIITVVYLLATLLGVFVFMGTNDCGWHFLWSLFAADVVATCFVWFFGLVFHNVSVYDPYWSVAPPVMLTLWAFHTNSFSSATLLLLVAVWYWGIRLTANWAFTFRNLNSEDWRYTKYRNSLRPVLFHLVNFFGLNMMPTVIVFLVMVPGFFLIEASVSASLSTIVGFSICIVAATLQLVADTQRHRFSRAHPGKVCNVGLWRHGRHPNYFGEILMWYGVWLMALPVLSHITPDIWLIGPLLNTALFCFISVPLMEKRQLQNKPDYAKYRENTRMFI